MAYTGIASAPAVGSVGQPSQLSIVGTPSSLSTPPEIYWYVQSAPANSAIKTLDQYNVLAAFVAGSSTSYSGPLPLGTQRSDIRLQTNAAGATFTPDVPGQYVIAAYDITHYKFVPHFGGHVPASGNLGDADNELVALPAYTGLSGAGAAPVTTSSVWVQETKTRTFGVGADTCKLQLTGYDTGLVTTQTNPDNAKIIQANSAAAKVAALDSNVLAALDSIKSYTTSSGSSTSALIIDTTLFLVNAWNGHIAYVSSWSVHGVQDGVNQLTAPSPTDLASCATALQDLYTQYNAHRVYTTGGVHNGADPGNQPTGISFAPDLTGLRNAWLSLRYNIFNHATVSTTVHLGGSTTPVDGGTWEWLEAPRAGSLAHLIAQTKALRTFYSSHTRKTTQAAPHNAADADNTITSGSLTSAAGIWGVINAVADSMEHHMANTKPDGSAPVTAYHNKPTLVKFPFRAANQESAARLLELLWIQFEAHALDGTNGGTTLSHNAQLWGGSNGQTGTTNLTRPIVFGSASATNGSGNFYAFAKAWNKATAAIASGYAAPDFTNSSMMQLAAVGGWTLPAQTRRLSGSGKWIERAVRLRRALRVAHVVVGLTVPDACPLGLQVHVAKARVLRVEHLGRRVTHARAEGAVVAACRNPEPSRVAGAIGRLTGDALRPAGSARATATSRSPSLPSLRTTGASGPSGPAERLAAGASRPR